MIRDLTTDDGAFGASQDADTEGIEGLTFTWTAAEMREVIGSFQPDLFFAAYGVTEGGNWEGRTILSRVATDEELRARFPQRAGPSIEDELQTARIRLLERRQTRPQPACDGKALAAWNGLAI